ncbi:MAG: pitrilysin family protein [Pseudomonadota bacterium]
MRNILAATTALSLVLAGCQVFQPRESDAAPAPALEAEPPAPALPSGMELVETVERIGDEIVIPYEKYVLPNGLTVILHEDRSDPLVHVDVTYHVGSGREDIGKSGFAHFFEHMMFQGSENVADEEHFKIVSESGGTLNGTTNSDRTNYFQTVPSNQLEKMLWLEADRMGFLLPAVTQEKFEVQRETVKNERGQRVDNRPYGLLFERVGEAMYPEGHPYSWSTIGYIEDLNRADLDDLKRFFLRWYGPNNAVLTIGGDLDRDQTLEWVVKYFGPIPRGPDVEDPVKPPVSLDADRYISLEDNIALPLIYMAWPTVYARHPDEAPLDVLMEIMGQGRTSLLYKNLDKDGFAVQSAAGHACRELHCAFTLNALLNPASGKTLAELEEIMRASLEEFETRGVQDDDLERVKASIVSGLIYRLESVSGKVSQLAFFETFANNPNYIRDEIARYENVTKADVVRVYEQYIKDKPAVIMSIVKKGEPDAAARPDTWERYERDIPDGPGETDLALRPPVDDFDRSVQPPAGANPAVKLPEIWRGALANGVEILGAVNDETPTTAISLRIKTGQKDEPMEKLGLAALTAGMLNEATTDSTNEELSNRLDKLGSTIRVSSGDVFTTMTIRSLTENLDETLAIAAEKLFKPAFAEADFERLKNQTLQSIEQSKTSPSATVGTVYSLLLYGRDNAFAYRDAGLVETVDAITLDDVRAFYNARYSAAVASIVAVSDTPQADMIEKLGVFTDWTADPVDTTEFNPLPTPEGTTLYFIHKPAAAQSEIRIGAPNLPFDATGRYYRARLMNFALGGAFNSRININLREDKGYTYGAFSFFRGGEQTGEFTAGAGVRTDTTKASITEFLSEIEAYRADGITLEELAFTKSAIGQSDARRYETPFQKLGFLSNILTYDLPDDFVDQQNAILADIAKPEIDALAAELLPADDKIIAVVGDRDVIMDDLVSLGFPIVELDADGNPAADEAP